VTRFAWTDGDTPVLRFYASERFRVAFTSRLGGVSEGPYRSLNVSRGTGDAPGSVVENRTRAAVAAGIDPHRLATMSQHHSSEVAWVDEPVPGGFLDPDHRSVRADGLATATRGVGLMALGADCLTVAVCAPGQAPRLAVAHAGWKGLLHGVLQEAVRQAGAGAVCAVGPSAGPCCYAVQADVGEPLRAAFGEDAVRDGKADLWCAAERALLGAGAAEVHVSGLCTICDERFFSHRRLGSPGGRQAVLAVIV
jgi:purine-nucleoside/S-methyl-5'-thioadenosine phosphorylase / adenosine deaminase